MPREKLARATEAIRHRGPDDSGVQVIKVAAPSPLEVGLGNRRLSILDLSPAGRQPMCDPETGNWIVYNGEVFNFRAVRDRLEGEGVRFTSQSDTEVVLKAYGRWGERCLEEFRGMFAFAVWDAPRRRLFVARDRLGVKPLYYSHAGGHFSFSSEVRALLEGGLVPRRLSRAGLLDYLSFGSACDPASLVEGVSALRPGHYLTWEGGRVDEVEYWDLGGGGQGRARAEAASPAGANGGGGRKTPDELRGVLIEAVSLRLVSDVPVGVFLSGGIDSSLLVGLISREIGASVNTFSIVFDEADYSEASFSRDVARRFGTDHHETLLSQDEAFEAVPRALAAMDQPTVDGINTYVVSREARRAGLKVALSGLGGDEVFAGYSTFRRVARMERFASAWGRLPASVRGAAAAGVSNFMPRGYGAHKLNTLVRGEGGGTHPYFLSRMLFVPEQRRRLLRSGGPVVSEQAERAAADMLRRAGHFDEVNRVSYLELRNYMVNTLLRDADSMSMAHGLEVRVPLLDHKLVEHVFSLPGGMKVDRRTPKPLLVGAVAGLLPDEVVYRPKRGFTLPFESWLRGRFRGEMERVLVHAADNPAQEFIDRGAVRQTWQDFLSGDLSWSRPWALYVLGRWCEMHM